MAIFRNTQRLILVLASLVFLYALVGFIVVPWVAESKLPELLSEQLGRDVMVENIAFNPFTLSLTILGFEVQEHDQSPLFGFQRLFVNFQLASILRQAYTFETIQLVLPYGLIKILPDGTLNVSALGPQSPSGSASREEETPTPQNSADESGLPAVEIDRLSIEQGTVEFHDESRPTPFSVDIVPIEISLNHFTTRADSKNPYAVTAEFGEGEMLQWEGTLVLEPFNSSGKLSLTGLRLHTPWQYLQDQLRFEIRNGVLDISTEYQVTTEGETIETMLSEGDLHISELRMAAKGNTDTVLDIPSFDAKGVLVDISRQRVTIPFVRSKDAKLVTWLNDKGKVNYQELFAPIDATERAADSSDVTPNAAEVSSNNSSDPERPWVVEVRDFALQNYTIGFEDRTLEPAAKLDLGGLDLQVKGLKTTFEEPFNLALALSMNDTGKVEVHGSVDVDPLVTDLNVKVSELALAPFYPYMSQHVQLEIVEGAVEMEGKMQYKDVPSTAPLFHYEGQVALNSLIARDPELTEEFLTLQSLAVHGLNLNTEPTSVSIGEIELTKPFIKATVGANGSMNLSRVFSPPGTLDDSEESVANPSDSETPEPAAEPLPVKIDRIRLVNAEAQFADLSLEPSVLTGIQELTGTISGLSSAQVAKADVDLKGKVDKYAPFEVKGKINPLSRDAYTDLILNFQNVDLTAVSPYSGKYAGHPITKGKLSLDLKYKIAEHVLEGENKVLIDQLTMGGETGSPDATSLPVPLALALLKDRHGKIDIDLPVRGNLDDPDFSYGGVVIQALLNLLTKVVTSPFALVGGLMGEGGDDLQFVEFNLGSYNLKPSEQEKLHSLAQALEERPALRLEVTGTADSTQDRQALIETKLSEQLQTLHRRQASPTGESPPQDDEQSLPADKERQLIRVLFVEKFGEVAAEQFENPSKAAISQEDNQNAQDHKAEMTTGPVQGEPWEQMKRRLIDAIEIPESEIRLLAQHRAQAIRDHLIQQENIPKERVFLIEVNLETDASQDHVRSPLSLTAG